MSPIVNSFYKKRQNTWESRHTFVAFWIKSICFYNFIMKVCILMLNQMHQKQDVINTPCVATYNKSKVKKKKVLWPSGCRNLSNETSAGICFRLLVGLLVPVFSHAPLWSCFLMANMVSKCRLALWEGKQNISGGPEGWARKYISFMSVSWF